VKDSTLQYFQILGICEKLEHAWAVRVVTEVGGYQ
jgi:hypothetical protein